MHYVNKSPHNDRSAYVCVCSCRCFTTSANISILWVKREQFRWFVWGLRLVFKVKLGFQAMVRVDVVSWQQVPFTIYHYMEPKTKMKHVSLMRNWVEPDWNHEMIFKTFHSVQNRDERIKFWSLKCRQKILFSALQHCFLACAVNWSPRLWLAPLGPGCSLSSSNTAPLFICISMRMCSSIMKQPSVKEQQFSLSNSSGPVNNRRLISWRSACLASNCVPHWVTWSSYVSLLRA